MASDAPAQSYDNHRKFVPGFHYAAMIILLINLLYSGYVAVTSFSLDSAMALLLAFGLVMIGLYARLFALKAQDRVIRLEERLRLHELLSPDQKSMIDNLSTAQLIGLRFASDGEVGELAAAVSAEGIQNGDEIKKRVKNWRADHQRV